MFTKVDFTEAKGKTIRAVVRNDYDDLFVSFTDGTFSAIHAIRSFDFAEIETNASFSPLDFRIDLILEPLFGECGKAMHEAAMLVEKERRTHLSKQASEKRRAEFEAMKLEFGEKE